MFGHSLVNAIAFPGNFGAWGLRCLSLDVPNLSPSPFPVPCIPELHPLGICSGSLGKVSKPPAPASSHISPFFFPSQGTIQAVSPHPVSRSRDQSGISWMHFPCVPWGLQPQSPASPSTPTFHPKSITPGCFPLPGELGSSFNSAQSLWLSCQSHQITIRSLSRELLSSLRAHPMVFFPEAGAEPEQNPGAPAPPAAAAPPQNLLRCGNTKLQQGQKEN